MQLFIFSPIFIVILYRSPYYGMSAIETVMVTATTIVGILSAKNEYWAVILANPNSDEQINGLYFNPLHSINTYLTGIVLGYILY